MPAVMPLPALPPSITSTSPSLSKVGSVSTRTRTSASDVTLTSMSVVLIPESPVNL